MARGFKTGGRVQGTPNNNHKALSEMLKDRFPDYHPVIALAEIGNDMQNDTAVRLHAHKEVAKDICPQLKSIEVADTTDNQIIVRILREDEYGIESEINKLGS